MVNVGKYTIHGCYGIGNTSFTNAPGAAIAVFTSGKSHRCLRGLEPMGPGEAAMRCAGDGGQHHYFHAR